MSPEQYQAVDSHQRLMPWRSIAGRGGGRQFHATTSLFPAMATVAALVGAILVATGPQDFPSAINTTAAALGAQAKGRFAANPKLLDLCGQLYQNTDDRYFYSFNDNLVDEDVEVLAFFLARDTVTTSVR